MSEVQKDLEDVFAGIDINDKIFIFNFSCYLRLKSAISTFTSPSPIRVKAFKVNGMLTDH
jgi:hypothetical protein